MMKKAFSSRRWLHILLLSGGIAVLAAVFYLLAAAGIGVPCLFHQITGLLCPGCGNSRAAIALLQLDIPGALAYNLLFPLEFFYIVWIYIHCCAAYLRGGRFAYASKHSLLDVAVLTAVILWGILRNLPAANA